MAPHSTDLGSAPGVFLHEADGLYDGGHYTKKSWRWLDFLVGF
ncbi:MAG: hypothetical protein SFV15_15945 [Polyangiaceae bacterium]|nr:hypothetical protein [Polyangiaceae bacterium]